MVLRTIGVCATTWLAGCQPSAVPSDAAPAFEAPARSGPDARPPEADAEPEPEPERDPRADRLAHEAIQRRQLRGQLLAPSHLVHATALEHPERLDGFRAALRRLERREEEGKVRVAVYGSSNVAGDRWPGYLRGYLQARYGDGGPGFVTLVPLWKWHRHQETRLDVSKGWKVEHALRAGGKGDGLYGLMGVRGTVAGKGSTIELRLRGLSEQAARWSLWFLAQPGGGSMTVDVGGETTVVETTAASKRPDYAALRRGTGSAQLKLRTTDGGRVHLFGVVIEREGAGVVVDQLGIGGSGVRRQLEWDEASWAEHLGKRDPSLYILAYGGIAAMGDGVGPEQWEAEFDEVVARFRRAVPEAGCLIVGPQDLALETGQGSERSRPPALDDVVAAQRRVADARGCAFFDTQAMMGGPGSMPSWVEAGLAMKDHIHFKRDGYAHLGRVITDAILDGR